MSPQTTKKDIDGESYEFVFLNPEDAIQGLSDLMNIVGPAGAKLISSIGDKVEGGSLLDRKIDMAKIGEAIGMACINMNGERNKAYISMMVDKTVLWKGQKVSINHPNFQGRLAHLFKVVIEASKANFAPFFSDFAGILGSVAGAGTTPAART